MRSDMSEYEAVEKAAMLFVKSVGSGDSAPARELFYDEAVMFGYLDGKLEHGPIQNLYDNIEDNWGGRIDFSDFLLLIKMDGEWKGVAKVYNQNSDTIRRD